MKLRFVAAAAMLSFLGWTRTSVAAEVARVGETVLTDDQMRQDLGMSMYQVENQMYQLKRNWVDSKAKEILFAQAAKDAKMTPEQWRKKEIESAVAAPGEQEVAQMAERFSQQAAQRGQLVTDPAKQKEFRDQATQMLVGQRRSQREAEVYQLLSQKMPVVMAFQAPIQPIINVTYGPDNPMHGPANAPVTIVEFTDLQCPWCARSQPNLKQAEEEFKGKVKIVARQFPLQMHPQAFQAAEAALCANEQKKFWEYRDKQFANQQKLAEADLLGYAKELQLKEKPFEKCLKSGKYKKTIEKDLAEGQKFGVQGTPTFFVNGRQVGFNQLVDTVREEVAKAK